MTFKILYLFFEQILGNFFMGNPKGSGKMYWINGDICVGEISGNICKGTKTTATGQVSTGEFDWRFDHENHQYMYNGMFHLLLHFHSLKFNIN